MFRLFCLDCTAGYQILTVIFFSKMQKALELEAKLTRNGMEWKRRKIILPCSKRTYVVPRAQSRQPISRVVSPIFKRVPCLYTFLNTAYSLSAVL
jgi:hypothetical protein